MKDLFGKAILDFLTNNAPEDLITETSISDPDEMSVAYLFRKYKDMPIVEIRAMQLAYGKVLDVGCGAGCHSLYLQNEKKLPVYSIDISEAAVEACKLQNLAKVEVQNLLTIEHETFDTILLLMNGTGIFGKLKNINQYLQKLKSLLSPKGQILIDSSDLIYMFDEDKDGGRWIPSTDYYGEITFTITYKGEKEEEFTWLYLDYTTLQNAAHANGLECELVLSGNHYDYLARLYCTLD